MTTDEASHRLTEAKHQLTLAAHSFAEVEKHDSIVYWERRRQELCERAIAYSEAFWQYELAVLALTESL